MLGLESVVDLLKEERENGGDREVVLEIKDLEIGNVEYHSNFDTCVCNTMIDM